MAVPSPALAQGSELSHREGQVTRSRFVAGDGSARPGKISCRDMSSEISLTDFRALAEFRHRIRAFLSFSEKAAREIGVDPRQHQLLLAIQGLPEGAAPSVGTVSERLQ